MRAAGHANWISDIEQMVDEGGIEFFDFETGAPVSAGMRAEIDWAHQMDIPIRFFDADFQEVHPA